MTAASRGALGPPPPVPRGPLTRSTPGAPETHSAPSVRAAPSPTPSETSSVNTLTEDSFEGIQVLRAAAAGPAKLAASDIGNGASVHVTFRVIIAYNYVCYVSTYCLSRCSEQEKEFFPTYCHRDLFCSDFDLSKLSDFLNRMVVRQCWIRACQCGLCRGFLLQSSCERQTLCCLWVIHLYNNVAFADQRKGFDMYVIIY